MIDPPFYAGEHLLDPAKVDQAAQGFLAGDVEHKMVGVVFAKRVIEDIRTECRLSAGLAGLGCVAFDQAGDRGRGAEGPFHHGIACQPCIQPVL